MNPNQILLVGISGVPKAGKDLFAEMMIRRLKNIHYIYANKFSITDLVKEDCKYFIKSKFDKNVYDDGMDAEFSDFYKWFSNKKREYSNGTYWNKELNKAITQSDAKINIITDIKFGNGENVNELSWLKENNGILVHLKKFINDDGISVLFNKMPDVKRIYLKAQTIEENDQQAMLESVADYVIEWEDQTRYSKEHPLSNRYLTSIVENFIITLMQKKMIY
jgi:hypothetical protein